jgi:hypothetical protein
MKNSKQQRKYLKRTHFKRIDGTMLYCLGDKERIKSRIDEEQIPDTKVFLFVEMMNTNNRYWCLLCNV